MSGKLTAFEAESIATGYLPPSAVEKVSPAMREYHGVTCSHPHNLPYNDECAVWWLRGTPHWRLAHTNLPPRPEGSDQ